MIAEYVGEELYKVFITFLYGIGAAFIYDILRILRRCIKHNVVAVSVEDILYWLLVSVSTFVMLIKINDGGLRFYFLIGAILGAMLYIFTAGKIVVRGGTVIFRKIPVGILKKLTKFIRIKVSKNKRRSNEKERKEI